MRSLTAVRKVFLHPIPVARQSMKMSLKRNEMLSNEWKEIEIEVPWGVMAAKWWGRQDVRPVLAVHGWLDNAGTFDRLIPLLPKHVGYLAIDLPGHGRSTHFPAGMSYHILDFLRSIERVRRKMNWDRVSLLGHSMGSKLSFYYASLKPDLVDMAIGIDVLKPLVKQSSKVINNNINMLDGMIIEDARQKSKIEPPSYSMDEIIARIVKGTQGSVTAECAPHLIERSVGPSVQHENKFFFQRDGRMKIMNYGAVSHEVTMELARRIVAPHLFIKANQSPYYEDERYFNEVVDELKRVNPLFKLLRIDSRHHVHLTEPEKVSGPISKFIEKYRPNV